MKILAVTITGIVHEASGSRTVTGNWAHGDALSDLVEARDIINRYLEGRENELVTATSSQPPIKTT